MKLISIVMSQVIWLGKVSGPGGGSIYGLTLAKACQERYGFLQGPQTLADYDLTKGIVFLHGYFNDFVIDKLQVYPNGVLADAKVPTDKCDSFLSDLVNWVTERGGVQFEKQSEPGSQLYSSQLEIQSDIDLERLFPQLSALGREIADTMRSYGLPTPDYRPSGLSLGNAWNDTGGFRFEGREGNNVPYGIFYAQARLKTADHLRLLERLESLLKTSAS
jgi:hypothetical protein